MNIRIMVSIGLALLLSACAPQYNYRNPSYEAAPIKRLLVVIDYTHFVDDVGEKFDYDRHKNKARIADIQDDLEAILNNKGYQGSIEYAVVSSGVGLNPELAFDAYVDNELLPESIYPPFFIQSAYAIDIQDALLNSLIDSQRIAFTSVSEDTQDYLQRVHLTAIDFSATGEKTDPQTATTQLFAGDSVAVLHIRVLSPRVSFVKAMGVSVISAGLTLGATSGAYIGMAIPTGRPHSTALLFDNQGGQVIWKNFKLGDVSHFSDNAFKQFFKNFPLKRHAPNQKEPIGQYQ